MGIDENYIKILFYSFNLEIKWSLKISITILASEKIYKKLNLRLF